MKNKELLILKKQLKMMLLTRLLILPPNKLKMKINRLSCYCYQIKRSGQMKIFENNYKRIIVRVTSLPD